MLNITNTTKRKVNIAELHRLAQAFDFYFQVPETEISLVLTGDALMRQINCDHRGQDRPTDVLSFPGLNEIIINLEQIKRQAAASSHDFQFELNFVLVHGLLHLLGHSDSSEKKRLAMIKLGEDFLSKVWYNKRVKYEDI